jgi:hypothetical protein
VGEERVAVDVAPSAPNVFKTATPNSNATDSPWPRACRRLSLDDWPPAHTGRAYDEPLRLPTGGVPTTANERD